MSEPRDCAIATNDGATDDTIAANDGATDDTIAANDGATDDTIAADDGATDDTIAADDGATDDTIATNDGATDDTIAVDDEAIDCSVLANNNNSDRSIGIVCDFMKSSCNVEVPANDNNSNCADIDSINCNSILVDSATISDNAICTSDYSTSNNCSDRSINSNILVVNTDIPYADATQISGEISNTTAYSKKSECFFLHDNSSEKNPCEIILCISCKKNFEYTAQEDEGHYAKGYRLKPELCNECKNAERQESSRNHHWSATAKSGFCFAFQRKMCMRGESCRYRHIMMGDPAPAPAASSDTRKIHKRPCFAFQRGECARGFACRYYHASGSPSICYTYFNTGECRRGESCRYYHTHS